ncbi:hypothetical protein [Bradyrhizobium japonicum]|uniref:hypothetical protein n=1 Tax=Bradyrhizobium japonicum TaxID=375 RepID=UPI002714E338|nr:hypothetical protein [Bradyrhizobium japonicum]WLB15027.1 hypothetical protein QIH95_23435 [Bradyrhizobium japonicum]
MRRPARQGPENSLKGSPIVSIKAHWRALVYWWSKRAQWLLPLLALVVGVFIIVAAGGPKPIGSSSAPARECGSGLAREIC